MELEELCIKCGQMVNKKLFRRHMDLHNGVQFKCYSCDKCYSRMDLLKRHEKIHGENPYFHCYLCDKSFQNKIFAETYENNT